MGLEFSISNQFLMPSLSSPQSYDVGDLGVVPREVAVFILTKLEQPLAVARVCRSMRRLAADAVSERLASEGVFALGYVERLGVPVNAICLEILRQFGVNLAAIIRSDNDSLHAELDLLLNGRLTLLSQPNALHAFLEVRLFDISKAVVSRLYSTQGLSAIRVFSRSSAIEKATPEGLSRGRTSTVRQLVASIREQKVLRQISTILVQGQHAVFQSPSAVSLHFLSLPPREVLDELSPQVKGLRVEGASMMPVGIGFFKEIEVLSIEACSMKSLPDEIADSVCKKLFLDNCPFLERLPDRLITLSTLSALIVRGCPALASENAVIKALCKRGVDVRIT